MLRSLPGVHVGFDDRVAVVGAGTIYEYDVPPEERVCYREERIAAIGRAQRELERSATRSPGEKARGDIHGVAQPASGAPGEGQTY